MDSWLEQARKASGFEEAECARLLNQSLEAYRYTELHPGTLTINQIRALNVVFNEEARSIVWCALREFDPSVRS